MKLQPSSTKPKRPRLISLHKVAGVSMAPTLKPGRIVVAVRARRLRPGDIVIFWHDNRRKIKRISQINGDKIFVVGDHPSSTDSRDFGWLPKNTILAKVIWPPDTFRPIGTKVS